MKKIVLFMAYYGKMPNYFNLWLETAKDNETIDFCVISDCCDEYELPKNVRYKKLSFDEFKNKLQMKFNFKISLNNYGRISQFRPAFAYVFPEEVDNYDFWGYVECDLLLGDIRKFLTDDLLEKYDKFLYTGHLQLFKNNNEMNTLFMKKSARALDYKFAFSNNIYFFEEYIGVYNLAKAYNIKTWYERVYADINCHYYGFKAILKENNDKLTSCIIRRKDKKMYAVYLNNSNEIEEHEVLYTHFQKRALQLETSDKEKYIIVPNKVVEDKIIDKGFWNEVETDINKEEAVYENRMSEYFLQDKKKDISSSVGLKCILDVLLSN